MDVKRGALVVIVILLMALMAPIVARPARADEMFPSEVRLPLKDYLALVETAERVDREKAEEIAHRETPVAEVVSQRVALTVGSEEIAVVSDFEVLLQGKTVLPVFLPVAGFPEAVEIRDEAGRTGSAVSAAVTAVDTGGGVMLAATQAGRYKVHVTGRAELGTGGGTGRVALGKVAAPVASTEVDLPADLSWSSPGAVVVEESEQNGRRRVRLATTRGAATVLNIRRKVDSAEAEKLLAQSVVLTIVQLRPEGLRRHDIVLYEVRRGGLGRFTVELPAGLEIEQAATDEGTVEPVVEGGRLTVHRRHQLQGVGYLVLTSTPPAGDLSLVAVKPEPEVRARYLAISLAVAADVHPLPAPSWTRVDTSDLPAMLSEALTALDLAAAWRLAADAKDARLAVAPLPPAPLRDAVIRRRDTIALLTVDGTLLFRDRFLVDARSRAGAALDVTLPAGGTLWSVKVDDQAVRPLESGGVFSVPLGFNSGTRAEVEIVSVQERVVPPGRSQLALDLPLVTAPVLVQHLRLLLPEGASYRFRRSELRYAPELRWAGSGSYVGRSNVAGNESGQTASFSGSLPAGTANLYVKVVDEQGSPLPGSTVTMQGALGVRVAVTNANGVAVLNGPGGEYSLKAELDGFSSQDYPSVQLPAGRSPGLQMTLSSAVEDVITVNTAELVADGRRLDTGATAADKAPAESESIARFKKEIAGLQQGLVGGVKPLPVSIPESGKALVFSGVLPPSHVTVELDVKGKVKS